MDEESLSQRKRKCPWNTSHFKLTVEEAEKRLGFKIRAIMRAAIPVDSMLENTKYHDGSAALSKVKEEVYTQIVRYLRIEGYPIEADPTLTEANVNNLVYATISPILDKFIRTSGRNKLQLVTKKQIASTDDETGSMEELVVVDQISNTEEHIVLFIEAKRTSIGLATIQCMLSMKDTRDRNGRGEVYGFITTGVIWRMLKYDGKDFCISQRIDLLFEGMDEYKDSWIEDYSILVNCMYVALSNGGL